MKWVVLAIIVFVAAYSWVMFNFRKPGPAHRPYEDAANRTTVSRLLASGYQRMQIQAERPAEPSPASVLYGRPRASAHRVRGGLDADLDFALAEKPLLAESIVSVTAPSEGAASMPYRVLFTASLQDQKRVISGAQLFLRGNRLALLPVFEPIRGELLARTRETSVILAVPAGTLPPGKYEGTLIGEKTSLQWNLELK